MPDSLTNDLFTHSVTANDASEYTGNGIVNYVIPWYMSLAASFPLPTDLPPDWMYPAPLVGYWTRDIILRMTPRHEPFFAGAIAKAAAKIASMSWEIKGERVERFRNMFVDWGGDGYVPSQKRGVRDYLTTNNGAFFEIVRASKNPSSNILGLVHLDSLRVMRTNDPEIPYVFLDLKGLYHELREENVIALVDMPNTATAAFGRGVCAADDVYQAIYKMAVMDRYLTEKVTGSGANVLDFITGLNDQQLQQLITTAKNEAIAKGQIYYQGHIIAGILAQVQMNHVSINLRELPDGYDRQKEIENSQLAYAVRIGLDPQDINPALLGGGSLGTGAQAQVLHEKQEGSVLSSFQKELTHQIDQKVLPIRATFYFAESDLREQLQKAQISQIHAQTRQVQVNTQEITASEARALAKEAEDIPADITVETLTDEQKPIEDTTPEVVTEPTQVQPLAQPAPAPIVTKEAREVADLLREAIAESRKARGAA